MKACFSASKVPRQKHGSHIPLSVYFSGWVPEPKEESPMVLYFWGAPKSLQIVIAAIKLKDAYSLKGKL